MASVAALKAEGNSLFGAKNFADAEKKYTGAIEASDSADSKGLAVLYANRSACRLSLKRYLDANADATKATDLDPTYAKAHARLATSEDQLGAPHKSKESWQKALDALPKTNLTPAEETQKTQYTAGLRAAISALAQLENTKHYIPKANPRQPGGTPFIWQGNGRMPWDLAAPIVARLRNEPKTPDNLRSSAWVIHHAYEDWTNGLDMIRQVKVLDERTGAMTGIIGAITHITNGIMRDPRVMHIPDNEFIGQYNKQITLEAFQSKAWTEAGPEIIIKEALERQRTQGWDATRPALSITIRAWIMRSMMALGLYQQHQVAVEFYRNSLTVIRTLRDHWILESKADRGVIFEKSFIFGIQGLYLDALMQSYHSSNGAESLEVLSNLFKEAEVLIREINETMGQSREHDPVDPGFLSSFFLYPKGEAYAMKGFYYNKMAVKSGNDPKVFFRKAAQEYLTAASAYPEDDEHHPSFLNAALGHMFSAGTFPVREIMDVMKRIRLSVPKAKAIWERSSLGAGGVWDIFADVEKEEQKLRTSIAEGQCTLDSCVGIAAEN